MRFLVLALMVLCLMGCSSNSSSSNPNVSLREFDSETRSSSNFNLSESSSSSSEDIFSSSVTTNVNLETRSRIDCEQGVTLNGSIMLHQIFVKRVAIDSGGHTFLFRDGDVLAQPHSFLEDDVIGIDIFQDLNGNNQIDFDTEGTSEQEYIRMSDIPVFSSTFPFSETVTGNVSYVFPIGSTEEAPDVSLTGCWMRITVDFL